MINSDRKAKIIVDLLRGLIEKDDHYERNECLEACLKAASMIQLEIKGVHPTRDKVTTMSLLAKNAMFSAITAREKGHMTESSRKTNDILGLMSEEDTDNLATQLENIGACLEAAIVLDMSLMGIDQRDHEPRQLSTKVHKFIRSLIADKDEPKCQS